MADRTGTNFKLPPPKIPGIIPKINIALGEISRKSADGPRSRFVAVVSAENPARERVSRLQGGWVGEGGVRAGYAEVQTPPVLPPAWRRVAESGKPASVSTVLYGLASRPNGHTGARRVSHTGWSPVTKLSPCKQNRCTTPRVAIPLASSSPRRFVDSTQIKFSSRENSPRLVLLSNRSSSHWRHVSTLRTTDSLSFDFSDKSGTLFQLLIVTYVTNTRSKGLWLASLWLIFLKPRDSQRGRYRNRHEKVTTVCYDVSTLV